ncbi:unnamed protein product [Cylindrotheca closterium]|uniref:Uncharacterized protein n=1 Tax=Cylindrotheca closterium TaxID=2856 RepID=A0AAD2FPT1_9STRA|nr:unnamed protein product [Cylindrotheca closterium]
MTLDQPSNNMSGSRKRRYQDRREFRASRSSFSSVNSWLLTPLHCFAILLLHTGGAMANVQVVALSYQHSPRTSASPAFIIPSHPLVPPVRNTATSSSTPKKQKTVTTSQRAAKSTTASIQNNKSGTNKNEHKSSVTFVGDSTTTLELDAPMELVQEFLQSDSSNVYLLGTDDIQCHDDHDESQQLLYECKQPIIEFMGLQLQPTFRHKLYRQPNQVTASIEEGSKAEIVTHSRHPAKRVISSLVHDATFVGESVVTVHPQEAQDHATQKCKLSINLSLSLQIPMPRFIPIPPGFNALGGAIVRRAGRLRTQQLLERLKAAYYQHQQEQQQEQQGRNPAPTITNPSVPSFEDNFRRILAMA